MLGQCDNEFLNLNCEYGRILSTYRWDLDRASSWRRPCLQWKLSYADQMITHSIYFSINIISTRTRETNGSTEASIPRMHCMRLVSMNKSTNIFNDIFWVVTRNDNNNWVQSIVHLLLNSEVRHHLLLERDNV
ncbi:hypothetical protein Gasu2_42800 [Galdieria sulphuraria]|nr:hypothetical protein Gasu2_42800 [Galdieria sulphuraria]